MFDSIDFSEFTAINYIGLILVVLLLFIIVFRDFVPKYDIGQHFYKQIVREGYENASYPNKTPDNFSDLINTETDTLLNNDLTFDSKDEQGTKYVNRYKSILRNFDTWVVGVVTKAVVEGHIDPKETDITASNFDANMNIIEKINKLMKFREVLEIAEKELA